MKKVLITWSAVYETVIEVDDNATIKEIEEKAASISIDVPGSEYMQDTWEISKIQT